MYLFFLSYVPEKMHCTYMDGYELRFTLVVLFDQRRNNVFSHDISALVSVLA
jgi:hypothetical protein